MTTRPTSSSPRIAILTHSTNPRGGVVHALSIAEALTRLGHHAVVHAPDPSGAGFFRSTGCATQSVAATVPADGSIRALVESRIGDYIRHFQDPVHRRFDLYHAHDGISGNALATLKEQGLIGAFARTVHHLDDFSDPALNRLQDRSIRAADRHFVVSASWRAHLARRFGITATAIGNGVDRAVFTPSPSHRDAALRARLAPGEGPLFLAVGGVEERKNSLNILRAFARLAPDLPDARLLIAGGVSLLDHGAYQARFRAELNALGDAARRVILAGAIAQEDMPSLYRMADTLVFPSLVEGFGLVTIEAIACGLPVVTARRTPFTEHFGDEDVVWCDPEDPASIARAMAESRHPTRRAGLTARTETILAPHDWTRSARAHLPVYSQIREALHA